MNTNIDLELLDFWFGFMRDKWFSCTLKGTENIDNLIKLKYQNYMEQMVAKPIEELCSNDDKINLSRIILFDQISRHVYRADKSLTKPYDQAARTILTNSGILSRLDKLDPESRCFALLPWRHTFEPELLHRCVELVSGWRQLEPSQPMYRRFYQATIKALASHYNKQDLLYTFDPTKPWDSILDPKSPCVFSYRPNIISNIIYTFKSNVKPGPLGDLVISVSGGVDSMVCLVLAKLCYPEALIKAISINYANRPEQDLEINMVGFVCSKLNVPHYVRTIGEIKRTRDLDREFYETITREIRFDCYSEICGSDQTPVVLGHNQDDSIENIFSNIKKKKNYNNLFGMDFIGYEKNVLIARPLLGVPKNQIIRFAHNNSIPYTYDSTPAWCERGRLRDILIPEIKSFDPQLIPGLIELVENYKQIYQVYANLIPEIDWIGNTKCEVSMSKIFILDYWKKVFTRIVLKYKIPFVTSKSLKHFITCLQAGSSNRITMSKNIIVQIDWATNKLNVFIC
jgi:tRNA(Ile)-lysidine synthetase-like protein